MTAKSRNASLLTGVFVVVILAAVNLLGTRFFGRADLTEKREYTISPSTRGVLGRLDDVVSVRAYFSKDLPPYMATLDRQVKDLLDEYRARSGGRIEVEFVDPTGDPAAESATQALGIPKVQLNIIERDKAQVTGAFLGIAVQFGDKTEVIPIVQSVGNLEYELTAAIVKATSERKTVGIAGSGEMSLNQGMEGLQSLLGGQYQLMPVSVQSGPIPDEVSTLIVVDNDQLDEQALYRIDQFVMRGGRLLVLAPGVELMAGSLNARDRQVKTGLLLRTWGVDVKNQLVADAQSAMATFSQGYMSFSVPYAWWPQVTAAGLSRENPVTATMDAIVLPWTSPLAVMPVDSTAGARVTATVLARSSERSFASGMPYDLNPQATPRRPATGIAAADLVVALSGRFPSGWRDGVPVPGDTLGTAPRPRGLSEETQIVVVGSARFVEDRFLQQFPSNAIFVANAIDWMTLGNDLIAIRSRGAAQRPLREIPDAERNAVKAAATFGLPVLVVIGGLVRLRLRKLHRARDARRYGGTAE